MFRVRTPWFRIQAFFWIHIRIKALLNPVQVLRERSSYIGTVWLAVRVRIQSGSGRYKHYMRLKRFVNLPVGTESHQYGILMVATAPYFYPDLEETAISTVLFLQYFTLTEQKMAVTIAHQKSILKRRNPVPYRTGCYLDLELSIFCQNIWILSLTLFLLNMLYVCQWGKIPVLCSWFTRWPSSCRSTPSPAVSGQFLITSKL